MIELKDKFYCQNHIMKKILSLLTLIFTLQLALPVSAQVQTQNGTLITTGYTENGVYYEIYGDNIYIQRSDSRLLITREVVYSGNIVPPYEISWQELLNNLTYTGTLYLKSTVYNPKTNKTTAIYQGVVTPK